MNILLILIIVVLSMIILAVAGIWYYRDRHVGKQSDALQDAARRRYRDALWDAAVRAASNRNAY